MEYLFASEQMWVVEAVEGAEERVEIPAELFPHGNDVDASVLCDLPYC